LFPRRGARARESALARRKPRALRRAARSRRARDAAAPLPRSAEARRCCFLPCVCSDALPSLPSPPCAVARSAVSCEASSWRDAAWESARACRVRSNGRRQFSLTAVFRRLGPSAANAASRARPPSLPTARRNTPA
jgi:hypothetical protein